jgi:hypothetical protein
MSNRLPGYELSTLLGKIGMYIVFGENDELNGHLNLRCDFMYTTFWYMSYWLCDEFEKFEMNTNMPLSWHLWEIDAMKMNLHGCN